MDYIHRLPFVIGLAAAIITGVAGYICNTNEQTLYLRMIVSMVVFYFIGVYIRYSLNKTMEELEQKKKENELKELEEAVIENQQHSTVDYKVGYDDELSPLEVSEVIKTKLKE
ncbi:MAG: hypothetical protein ACOX7R_12475 [Acetivibrionales bacterium]|jgi:uncharacterized membrane protein